MRYFLRTARGITTYDVLGRPIVTERITPAVELIATDDPDVIKTLESFIKRHIGGITETTLEGIEELKKKAIASPPPRGEFYGGPMVAQDTITPAAPSARDAAALGSSMLPIAEEVKQLRADVAALKEKGPQPGKSETNIPPPVPPSVGKRTSPKT